MLTRPPLLAIALLGTSLSMSAPFPTAPRDEPKQAPVQSKKTSADFGARVESSEGWGVRVKSLRTASPASLAGVQIGDLILGIGGQVTESPEGLRSAVGTIKPRSWTRVVIRRKDEIHVLDCLLGDYSRKVYPFHPDSVSLRQALDFLQVKRGEQIADIGFGNGWLTFGLARATGLEGRVFAVEIIEPHVDKMRRLRIPNLTPVLSKADDVSLEENSLDLAVMADVVSHIEEEARPAFYASLARALRPEGRLVAFCPHGQGRIRIDELASFGFHPENSKELEGMSEKELDQRVIGGVSYKFRE